MENTQQKNLQSNQICRKSIPKAIFHRPFPLPARHGGAPLPRAPLVSRCGRARCPHRAAAPSARCAAWHPAPSPGTAPPRPRRSPRTRADPTHAPRRLAVARAAWQVAHAESVAGASPYAPCRLPGLPARATRHKKNPRTGYAGSKEDKNDFAKTNVR